LKISEFATFLEEIDKRSGRIEITQLLTEMFRRAQKNEVKPISYMLLGKVAPDFEGLELGLGDKMIMRAIALATGASLEKVKELYDSLGDLGLVAEKLREKRAATLLDFTTTKTQERDVVSVFNELLKIANTSGEGAQDTKIKLLAKLISELNGAEVRYVVRMASGDIRIGVADQTIIDALAAAFSANEELVERAYNITSDLGFVAEVLAISGEEGLKQIKVQPGRPLKPMLAERAQSLQEIFEKMGGKAAFEYKYDGERVQAHKYDSRVELFSRRIERITYHYPDVVEALLKGISAQSFIVEGEIVAVEPETGEMMPFQELMHRRRKYDVEEALQKYPAKTMLFDVLYVDGVDYTSKPYLERRKKLEEIVQESDSLALSTMMITQEVGEAQRFFDEAISAGCEGIMAKTLDPAVGYRAGNRGWAWIKYKRDYKSELTDTLDLVVVGGFYGRGKRAGKIGGYLLAAYNPSNGSFDTVCKVATGFSDEDLVEIPKMLEQYRIPQKHPSVNSKLNADVWYKPVVVMEIVGAELTLSPTHTAAFSKIREGSGLAVRFPRFTGRIRSDKSATEATTVDELVEMYKSQLKKVQE